MVWSNSFYTEEVNPISSVENFGLSNNKRKTLITSSCSSTWHIKLQNNRLWILTSQDRYYVGVLCKVCERDMVQTREEVLHVLLLPQLDLSMSKPMSKQNGSVQQFILAQAISLRKRKGQCWRRFECLNILDNNNRCLHEKHEIQMQAKPWLWTLLVRIPWNALRWTMKWLQRCTSY